MSETEVIAGINKVLGKLSEEKHKKRFGKWNKLIGFTFKDFGKTWVTTLTAGVPSELEEREIDKSVKYDILVSTTPATWLGVLNKEIDAMKAFTSGDLKIKGSLSDLLKLRKVL
ncbi:MAG: SCP2 sterol-binding domain-containing protein [Candidatus Hodarchaeota archaeon]